MCGKYSVPFQLPVPIEGSPPHVREILNYRNHHKKLLRITPACAGNTPRIDKIEILAKDHPRMCGKYVFVVLKPYLV